MPAVSMASEGWGDGGGAEEGGGRCRGGRGAGPRREGGGAGEARKAGKGGAISHYESHFANFDNWMKREREKKNNG